MNNPSYNTNDDPTDLEGQLLVEKDLERIRTFLNEQSRDDLRTVMGTKPGRRFIWNLVDFSGVWSSSAGPMIEHLEGRRSIGLFIWGQLQEVCPDLLMEMQRENLHV